MWQKGHPKTTDPSIQRYAVSPYINALRGQHFEEPSNSVNGSRDFCIGNTLSESTTLSNKNRTNKKVINEKSPDGKSVVGDAMHKYCEESTIHGLKYVGDTSLSQLERFFWILSFFLAICGAAYYIWHLYSKFSLTPIITSRNSESVSINQFPFPAITICNMNNAKKSVAKAIKQGNDPLQKFFLEDICDSKNEDLHVPDAVAEGAGEWENIYSFLLSVSQNCSQMLHHCEWHGNITNCTDVFNPVLTDEGLCCRFNSVQKLLRDPRVWENLEISYASEKRIDWNPEYRFTDSDPPDAIPWRAYGSGCNYGLSLTLDVDVDEYYCSSTASVGFKMLLHSPVETPQISDFAVTLSPGKETRVIVTPYINDADKSIMKIPPKTRRCYFLTEKHLRYYRTYTQRNCVLECEANFTLKYCKCIQYYMPVSNDTRICGKMDDECANLARKIMKNKLYEEDDPRFVFNVTEAPSCKCYPGCNEINYSTEISQSMLMATFEIPDQYFKNDGSYFERNIAIVHIFFVDSSYIKYTKSELYGFAELLSNTGGLLGLFMGFSLMSVTEILYYFTIRLWLRIWKDKLPKIDEKKQISQLWTKKDDNAFPYAP